MMSGKKQPKKNYHNISYMLTKSNNNWQFIGGKAIFITISHNSYPNKITIMTISLNSLLNKITIMRIHLISLLNKITIMTIYYNSLLT